MSLAQRRTTLDDIGTIPPTIPEEDVVHGNIEYTNEEHNDLPAEDGKEFWQTISYDPFGEQCLPELHHYESFPSELTEHLPAYEVSTAKRICQVIFAVVACGLASGIVCGFAALKPILITEGVYAHLCPADWPSSPGKESQIPCPEQDMRLNLFFITASITLNMSTVLAGWVLDNYGRRICYLLAALVLFLGAGCMALAFWLDEEWKLIPYHIDGYLIGNLLLGLGGTFLFVSSYQLSNTFPRHTGLIVALVTGAFDASAAVFLFYHLAYEATSHAFKPAYFFLGFALFIPLLLLMAEFTLMPKSDYHTRRDYQAAIARAQDATRDIHDSDEDQDIDPGISYSHHQQQQQQHRASLREAELAAIETVTGDVDDRRVERETARARHLTSGVYGILQDNSNHHDHEHDHHHHHHTPSVLRQMATPWFWLLLLLTVLQMTRMNYFIATVRAQYRFMLDGDEGLAERVNSFFDVVLPVAGVLTTPLIGVLLNEVPVWGTLGVLTFLIVVLGVLNCISGSLCAGYATVVAFVVFRPLYYSAVSDYTTKVFGFSTFGRIYGTIICISGVGQFIQPALDALTHGPLHNNPILVNAVFAVVGSIISLALTLFVYIKTSENSERKNAAAAYNDHTREQDTENEQMGLLQEGRSEGYMGA